MADALLITPLAWHGIARLLLTYAAMLLLPGYLLLRLLNDHAWMSALVRIVLSVGLSMAMSITVYGILSYTGAPLAWLQATSVICTAWLFWRFLMPTNILNPSADY